MGKGNSRSQMSSVYLTESLHMLGTSVKRILPDELRHYKVMFEIAGATISTHESAQEYNRVKFGI